MSEHNTYLYLFSNSNLLSFYLNFKTSRLLIFISLLKSRISHNNTIYISRSLLLLLKKIFLETSTNRSEVGQVIRHFLLGLSAHLVTIGSRSPSLSFQGTKTSFKYFFYFIHTSFVHILKFFFWFSFFSSIIHILITQ